MEQDAQLLALTARGEQLSERTSYSYRFSSGWLDEVHRLVAIDPEIGPFLRQKIAVGQIDRSTYNMDVGQGKVCAYGWVQQLGGQLGNPYLSYELSHQHRVGDRMFTDLEYMV